MDYKNIYFIIFLIYILILLITLFVFIYCIIFYNRYYINRKRPEILILISILVLLYIILLEIEFLKTNLIIKLIRDIIGCFSGTLTIFREVNIYVEKCNINKNKLKKINIIHIISFITDIILIFYTFTIIIYYYKNNFEEDHWQYYPFNIKYICSVILVYPLIFYMLYKKDVKCIKETIYVCFLLCITYIFHILYNFVFTNSDLFKFISKIIISSTIMMIHLIYCVMPIYYIFKFKNIKKENYNVFYKFNIGNKKDNIIILNFIEEYDKNINNIDVLIKLYTDNKNIIKSNISPEMAINIEKNINSKNLDKILFNKLKKELEDKILLDTYKSLI